MTPERKRKLQELQAEAVSLFSLQPSSSWTIAKMKLVYPSPPGRGSLVTIDNVAAAGACNAIANDAIIDQERDRIEIVADFSDFRLSGSSQILGPFEILLQKNLNAKGRFISRFADSLFPVFGSWEVPFLIKSEIGNLVPRPSSDPVLLKTSEPGEYEIPPIGTWFEKWDPIDLVKEGDPDGPTVAICEHAMHCMINPGDGPDYPSFYKK